jgi:hypothetical protein
VAVSRAVPTLRRGWWGVSLPGYRDHAAEFATYSGFDTALPPIERELDEALGWLREQEIVPESLSANLASPGPTREATADELMTLIADARLHVPSSFATFVSDPELRERVRSCTACYLDLADFVVPAQRGSLLHFLSDQQWVLHWLLYVGEDGSEAVIATDTPYGFELEAPGTFAGEPDVDGEPTAIVCAESFNEFLYRFWIENEIWFALADPNDKQSLTEEQRRYIEHYRRSGT